jgi:tetratricopeptide (TPR) repeat protein
MSDRSKQSIVVIVAAIALYGLSCSFGYVLDDKIVLTENQFVKKGFAGLGDIFTTEGFEGYFGEQKNLVFGARYRPLSLAMFAVEYAIVGLNPWLSHLMNVLLYALLGFFLLRWSSFTFPQKTKSKWFLALPFMVALLFVLHPIHSEAVANIKGRDEILATLFSMSTLLLAQKFAANGKLLTWASIFVSFLLAMLSKENSITFLAVVPLTIILFSKVDWKRMAMILFAMMAAAGLYIFMRFDAVGYLWSSGVATGAADLMNNPFVQMDSSEKLATTTYTLGRYIQLLLFPHPLTHDYYPYHIPKLGWDSALAIGSLILQVALLLWAAISWKKRPVVTWSVLFYFITLSIVSNIPFTVGTFMNERFIFLPSLGFVVLLGFGLNYLISSARTKNIGLIVTALILLGYATKTITRVPDWKSGEILNQSAIKVSKNSARINMFVGADYLKEALNEQDPKRKRTLLDQSKFYLEKAKRIYPIYSSANHTLSGVCAEMFKMDGNIDKLLDCFVDVAGDGPNTAYLNQFLDYLKKRGEYTPELTSFYERAGFEKLYEEKNNFPAAIRYLREAESLNPGIKSVYSKLSTVYLAFGYHLQEYPDPQYKAAEMIESGRYYGNMAVR